MIIIAGTKQENAIVERLAKENLAQAWKREDSFAVVRWSKEDLMGVKPELNEKEAEAFLEYYEGNIKNLICGEGFQILKDMDASDFATETEDDEKEEVEV